MKSLHPTDPVRLGPYGLLARLGHGGMGTVYLGRADGDFAAVKVVSADHARSPEAFKRFERETAAMGRLRSPYVAELRGSDPHGDPAWMATEYVPGVHLGEVVEQRGPLPTALWWDAAHVLLAALESIHDQDIVHRDVKPSNVMVSKSGPKVIDFGVSHLGDRTALTATGVMIGSVGWMAPEQIAGGRATPAGDVFAAGAVLAYAATGRSPFPGTQLPRSSIG